MSNESYKTLIMLYIELWKTGNLEIADEIFAPDYVDHTHPERAPGPEPVKQEVQPFRASFPGASITIEQMIGEGDLVAFRFTMLGTHQRAFAGFPAAGKEVILTGMDFVRIADGKLVELWSCQDTLSWVLQLGVRVEMPGEV
jgi:steroid delta-isomerase-like uncharacterized protein